MSKEEILEWANSVKWEKYIDDKAVLGGLTQLKERISSLKQGGDGSAGGASQRVKLVVVGDGAVGKTSLLISFAKGNFPTDYVPTVFENYTAQTKLEDGTPILLHLWDTAGQEDYDRLRPLSYPGADIVLLCFSTVTKSSYASIKEKWYPEVNHYVPDVPYFLIGTKVDLRDEEQADPTTGEYEPVTKAEGEDMKSQIHAVKYLEVSSKTRQCLDKVFQLAVETVLKVRKVHSGDDDSEKPQPKDKAKASAGASEERKDDDNEIVIPPKPKKRRGCYLL
eukprot:TRINITY_DN12889_c0_g1_i1.p1 TRINITY_DN12889_c0_g1~~TRINITY_DN12889_c0_g1_i1.p1  ORF type:complete len:279 (-),score=54.48 TRINITY_DN12889_c0_g1_i1:154-990(-)